MYLSIKKIVETEEDYTVTNTHLTIERIKVGLESGDLNIVPVACVEPIMWLVNKDGQRVAVLEKQGGYGPSEEIAIKTGNGSCIEYENYED